jgi:hypothetical protein
MVWGMMRGRKSNSRKLLRRLFWALGMLLLAASRGAVAEPPAAAVAGFNRYVAGVEARLARQHDVRIGDGFVVVAGSERKARLRAGELLIERLTPADGGELPGAILHHWRATAFAPGATAAELDRVMRDVARYPQVFAPEVLRAGVASGQGDRLNVAMRVRQKHVITVVMDTEYAVEFGRPVSTPDAPQRWSASRSTRIAEIEDAGTQRERVLSAAQEHGFLWRQNTYWSYEERDGGLYLQVESVSLTRAIPVGLGWAVRPFVESVPRESLEFTLRSVRSALKK